MLGKQCLWQERCWRIYEPFEPSVQAAPTHALSPTETQGCWGRNNDSQTDVPEDLGTVQAITAGGTHALSLPTETRDAGDAMTIAKPMYRVI